MKLTIQLVREPAYMTPEGKHIHMFVKFAEFDDELPYVAWADDPEEHGRFLYSEAVNGVYGPVRAYTPPPEGQVDGNQALTS